MSHIPNATSVSTVPSDVRVTLEAREVTLGYSSTSSFGDTVSFALNPGRVLAVVGPNGSGKTTLLRTLAGVLPPRSGEVRLSGRDVRWMARREVATELAYLPQNIEVAFEFDVNAVVSMGRTPHVASPFRLSREDELIVREALAECDLLDLAGALVRHLSTGQQKRVALARVLAQRAKVVLLDEPTASVDQKNTWLVVSVIRKLARGGKTVVFSSHDTTTVTATGAEVLEFIS